MPTATDPRAFSWGLAGQLVTAAIAACAALLALTRSVLRPIADNSWLATMRRRRNDVDAFMRNEIFRQELDARVEQSQKLDRMLLIAEDNGRRLDNVVSQTSGISRSLSRVEGIVDMLQREAVARNVGRMEPK